MHGGVMETIKVDPEQEQEGSTRGPMSKRFWFVPKDKAGIVRRGSTTRAPYGLEIVESCLNCPHHEERLFCNLSPAALKHLETITAAASYPKGATLIVSKRSEEHTSELQSRLHLVCRLLLEKKKQHYTTFIIYYD